MIASHIITREERREDGLHYTYELIRSEGKMTADWGLPLYSVRISMTDDSGNKTQKEAKDIFADEGRAYKFFDMLVRNLATPIDLGYVVEDELIN